MRFRSTSLFAGTMFGFGLTISGMADPANVRAFLKLGRDWSPSLMFVFLGALLVAMPGFFWLKHRVKPFVAEAFVLPPTRPVDRRLVFGSALFGMGWGIAGCCPGPIIVNIGFFQGAAWLFFFAFLVGGRLVGPFR